MTRHLLGARGERLAARLKWLAAERDWLPLAAAPTFASMALMCVLTAGPSDLLCSAAQHTSSVGGTSTMYLLMSLFHLSPWLRLLTRRP
jgi:hypothetical protein